MRCRGDVPQTNFLKDRGYERYEISNYARPGMECRHNLGYWTGVSYLGLGLGPSSYVNGCRFCNELGPGVPSGESPESGWTGDAKKKDMENFYVGGDWSRAFP